MVPKIKCCGYVRVSTSAQVDKESLSIQTANIKNFAKLHGYKLTEIYRDEGISGGSITDRLALQKCLQDGKDGKFSIIIIHRLSRFGRNARELLENHEQLKQAGVELRSISEGIDFSTKYGKAFLGILAVIAELERDIIKETMLESRIGKAKRGFPTSGKLPFARTFDKETKTWKLDPDKALMLQHAAQKFLAGGSLFDIAQKTTLSYTTLRRTLAEKCGSKWTVIFKDQAPITYTVPRILSDETIKAIQDRLTFNRRNNRTDLSNRYVLSGFLMCEKCGKNLIGKFLRHDKGVYLYYGHNTGKRIKCSAFTTISLPQIEKAIFETIYENFIDMPSFEQAIAASLPDETLIKSLENRIAADGMELKRITKELEKLVQAVLSGTLNKITIQNKEKELLKAKVKTSERLEENKSELKSLPDINLVKKDALKVRRELMERFGSKKHLQEMSFNKKRKLLHWLFDGKDKENTKFGIFINKTGLRENQQIDYFMYGRITGLRTLRGDDINYLEHLDDKKSTKIDTFK